MLHIIGYSHIDAAWLWPWRDGADRALDTFRSALNRIDETPGFCYTHSHRRITAGWSGADPAMFAQMKQRIREGRWEVAGGWLVEPDCNIPSTESFVRQSLYGKEYCRRALGVDVRIAMNPDSFGHAAGLPTILKSAGYRLLRLHASAGTRDALAARLLVGRAGRITYPHHAHLEGLRPGEQIRRDDPHIAGSALHHGLNHAALFLGVGDHGGAVTREQIRTVLELQKDPACRRCASARWPLFQAVEKSPAFDGVPVVKGELQHHARGCYSAYGEGKYLNRRAERMLGEAEAISVAAASRSITHIRAKEFAESWWKVTFCQFHDMMAGTSLYCDYLEVRDSLGYACETAQTTKVEALEAIAMQVDTSGVKENALFLFNPLPWPRKALAEVIVSSEWKNAGRVHLAAKDGRQIATAMAAFAQHDQFLSAAFRGGGTAGLRIQGVRAGAWRSAGRGQLRGVFQVADGGFGIASLKAADGTELLSRAGRPGRDSRYQRYVGARHRAVPRRDRPADLRISRAWLRTDR